MFITLYREGNDSVPQGAGFPTAYAADGTEPEVDAQGYLYNPARTYADLTGLDQIRVSVNVLLSDDCTLSVDYSTDDGATWDATGAEVEIDATTTATQTAGAYTSLPADCDDVMLRAVVSDEGTGKSIIPLSISIDAR